MAGTVAGASQRREVADEVRRVREFIRAVERMGGRVPGSLKSALDALQLAANTGQDLGASAERASAALAAFEKDLKAACRSVDTEMDLVCEAQVARQWQSRSVRFTLDYRNPRSVTAQMIRATVRRYTPELICRHWDYCRQEAAVSRGGQSPGMGLP